MPDGWEVQFGLNPLYFQDAISDLDNDGLKNFEEYLHSSRPNDTDSDDDGYSDKTEVIAGTDPMNPDSYPIESVPIDYTTSIIIGCTIAGILVAGAIIVHGILMRSRTSKIPTPPKKSATDPKHPTPELKKSIG